MEETNLARWFTYMQNSVSPDSFIRWGFFSAVASALERRIWIGTEHDPLFLNLFSVLVAPPGVGKGRTISPVAKLLRHHKNHRHSTIMGKPIDPNVEKGNSMKNELPSLIQVGADATTYEALVKAMTLSARAEHYQVPGTTVKKMYMHSSMTFCLPEISSLFRKHTEDLVNFLLVAYDCEDYRYSTISRGDDTIRRCCLNFLAGTTPGFIKRVFGDDLLTDGFSSRAIFICENFSRFRSIKPSVENPRQAEAYKIILDHFKKLTELYGPISFTDEALAYLESWWEKEPTTRVNRSQKLIPYYARKDITTKKLAAVLHFCDTPKIEPIGLDKVLMALEELAIVEKKMHNAVTLDNKNPVASVTNNMLEYLQENGLTKRSELWIQFYGELPKGEKDLIAILDFLVRTGKIEETGGKYKLKT